ncbi:MULTISPECIES: 2-dehydro-3-deoxygalactonokinase [unclassified Roseivivax]|uniref:2-dehydro-3-deoxygalactonokinase n=1 Tax=Roseivivax sp. GX 12232 TaxID=2900547 RepID=UPI001E60F413|nr:2-dehydro-3-deoxygalactonokinase [Roseivivax sp. GX 12232]MCE0506719.1 2-dehydro-3-deoxygalactonokinase [Roseivivax sp. GX 12232]
MAALDWIAVDWGTSNLRAWLIGQDGAVADRRSSDQGMNRLDRAGFEPALLDLVGDALPADRAVPVVVCGMAGSRQGWAEAPYRAVPCAPPGLDAATEVATEDPRLAVRILPGIKQAQPADVMRGEETQIAGIFAARPEFDGTICLPGTHTKWVQCSAREVVSFRTYMTGEIFALLRDASVLRHSLGTEGWDAAAFDAAVSDAMSRPAPLAANLFSLRAEALLADLPPETALARLSGQLIGMELAGARAYWLGQPVIVAGNGGQAEAYARALEAQGAAVDRLDAEDITLAGLTAARAQLRKAAS